MADEFKDLSKQLHAVNKCAKVISKNMGQNNDLYKYLYERSTVLTQKLKTIERAVGQFYPSGGNYKTELRRVGNYGRE